MRRWWAVLLVLAACSSSSDDATVATSTSSTTSTVATTTTVDEIGALTRAIVAAETAVREPATPDIVRAGREQQVAYRTLVERPEWLDQVLAGAPAALRDAIRANVTAGQKLRSLSPPKNPAPPTTWRIVEPAPASELLGYCRDAEKEFGVPWGYLAAVHLVETRMGRIRGESSAGAQGPMQFLPSTWAAYGEGDINSNKDSIRAAARYLKRNGAPGDMRNALWNYNHSFLYVDAVTEYAKQMLAAERVFFGYHQWQVYYRTTNGDVLLPVGYGS